MASFRLKWLVVQAVTSLRVPIAIVYLVFASRQARGSSAGTTALILLLFSVGSDVLDGRLARRWRAESVFGAHLDIATDIIFVASSYVAAYQWSNLAAAALVFVLLKDIEFYLTSRVAARRWQHSGPYYDSVGKYVSGFTFSAGTALIAWTSFELPHGRLVGQAIMVAVIVLTSVAAGKRIRDVRLGVNMVRRCARRAPGSVR